MEFICNIEQIKYSFSIFIGSGIYFEGPSFSATFGYAQHRVSNIVTVPKVGKKSASS